MSKTREDRMLLDVVGELIGHPDFHAEAGAVVLRLVSELKDSSAERDTLAAQVATLTAEVNRRATAIIDRDERVAALTAEVERLTRERDEARAKSAIDEAGYDHVLVIGQQCLARAAAAEARVTALEAALRRAEQAVHSEYCGARCHQECVAIVAALTAPKEPGQ